jgi:AraC-like DNA-binding protein
MNVIPVGGELPPMDTPREPDTLARPKGNTRGQAGERFRVLNSFVDFTLAELSRAEIAAWLILYRDTRDGSARTSMRDIARRAGCSPRAVATAVARLEKLGLLKTIHRGGFRRGASRYRIKPLLK